MALPLISNTPQSIKDKKVHDDVNSYTNDDLQDVLDGLIKLGVSDNNNHHNATPNNQRNLDYLLQPWLTTTHSVTPSPSLPLHTPSPHTLHRYNTNNNNNNNLPTSSSSSLHSHSHSQKRKKKYERSTSPNRHNPAYRQQPTFIANSRTLRHKQQQNAFSGMNLLMAAVNKVEGRTHFKIDIADIDRITHKSTDDHLTTNDTLTVHPNNKSNSKSIITAPKVDTEELILPTFQDLNDDFSPLDLQKRDSLLSLTSRRDSSIRQQLRFSNISSIGRRSSMGLFNLNHHLSPSYHHHHNPDSIEQQQENRRISREWSKQNIKEMDEMYHNKTKLAQKRQFNKENDSNLLNQSNPMNLTNSSKAICQEFSESNHELTNVINDYKQNLQIAKQEYQKKEIQRQQQNQHFQQQCSIMQQKIDRFEQREREIAKAREQAIKQQQQQQEQRQQQLLEQQRKQQAQAALQQQQSLSVQPGHAAAIQPGQVPQHSSPALSATQPGQPLSTSLIDINSEWYPHENDLSQTAKHYENMYKQFETMMDNFEQKQPDKHSEFEMQIGLIIRAIASNTKSVLNAYDRFKTLVNDKTSTGSIPRQYCFIHVTNGIINDTRIVKQGPHKFAAAYFLSFVMTEYQNQYTEIFKCCFHHHCIWTIPYINKQLRDVRVKRPQFNALQPGIVRCVLLRYKDIKNVNTVPSAKRKYLQQFAKDNNAGRAIFESEDKYFTRNRYICGLFAAFMSIRDCNTFKNPIGIDSQHCWKWMAQLLCLPQCIYPELCAILLGIIKIIGHDMLEMYPKQFPKLLKYIQHHIVMKSDESTTMRGKSKRELNRFLKETFESKTKNNGKIKIEKPVDSKLIAETAGAKKLTANSF